MLAVVISNGSIFDADFFAKTSWRDCLCVVVINQFYMKARQLDKVSIVKASQSQAILPYVKSMRERQLMLN